MIQPNELRIGNWVYESKYFPADGGKIIDPELMQIREINGNNAFVRDANDNTYDFYLLHPIPLTPEILEAAGFKKHEAFTYDYYYRVFLQTDTKGCEQQSKISIGRNGTEVFINNRWLCEVKYLHTLQNLFFSISGQELTVSPL